MDVTVGATLTGGSTIVLAPAGFQPGKSAFVSPNHDRLVPETIEFTSTQPAPSAKDPGIARTGVKISFASRVEEEGCCTVKSGAVILDLGVRWSLSQPETVVDAVLGLFRGLVFTTEFNDAVKKGILPSS